MGDIADKPAGKQSCQGVLGKVLGHKFLSGFGYLIESDFCFRCGMPRGGWGVRL